MSLIQVNGVEYHYRRSGAGQTLVMLHGFSGSAENWAAVAESLNPKFETIAIDLLGHGRTESPAAWSRYSMAEVAGDVLALIEHLQIAPVDLLGYSMGGRLALYLGQRQPATFRSLILESASPGIADGSERELRQGRDTELADEIEQDGVQNFVDRWENIPLFASQKYTAEERLLGQRQQRLRNNKKGIANSLRGMGTGSQPSLWASLPSINLPSLLICGALDEKYVQISREMARLMPAAELNILQEAGHNVHFEQPAQFTGIAANFLAKSNQLRSG